MSADQLTSAKRAERGACAERIAGVLSLPRPTGTMTPAGSHEVPLIRGSITDESRSRSPSPKHH